MPDRRGTAAFKGAGAEREVIRETGRAWLRFLRRLIAARDTEKNAARFASVSASQCHHPLYRVAACGDVA